MTGVMEPDMDFISKRAGTYMFGVNNEVVEFTDIKMD